MNLHGLYSELKRRKVLRVVGVYAVGGWVAAQVADVFAPALGLPDATVSIVAAAVVAGFPLAFLLAWFFEITPEGIRRTGPAPDPSHRGRSMSLAAVGFVVIGAALFTGVFALTRKGSASEIDPNSLYIVPFRVAGDPSLDYLREGMVDLLSAKFTGIGGPRAVDTRTALAAWHGEVKEVHNELTRDEAVDLARSVGAGQVMLGEVVATGRTMTLNATIYNTDDDADPIQREVKGDPDSLVHLVDKMAADLMGMQAGADRQQLEAFTSTSLDAVRPYLAGQVDYRRGNFIKSAEHFKAAVDADSTFALAALGLLHARGWSGYGPDYTRAQRLVSLHRDRLPPRERSYIIAMLGPDFPATRVAPIGVLRALEKFVSDYADWPEAWYALGDVLFHSGGIGGYRDSIERALEAFDRALELDPGFAPARAHSLEAYAILGDTASLREAASIYFQHTPTARFDEYGWLTATVLRDTAALTMVRSRFDSLSTTDLGMVTAITRAAGLPHADAFRVLDIIEERANTPAQKFAADSRRMWMEMNAGHTRRASQIVHALPGKMNNPAMASWALIAAMYPDADTTGIESLARTLESLISSEAAPPAIAGSNSCAATSWRMRQGNYAAAKPLLAVLRTAAADSSQQFFSRICLLALEASQAHAQNAPDAAERLRRLDSALINHPVAAGMSEFANFISMNLHSSRNNVELALAAAYRRDHYQAYLYAPTVLEMARLHARAGDRAEAIKAYRNYLKLRPDPESGLAAAQVARARAELAALVGER